MAKNKNSLPANQTRVVKQIQEQYNLSGNAARKVVRLVQSQVSMSYRSGPFPHPEEYEHYMDIDPELPELIKAMAQKEQDHLHNNNIKDVENQLYLRKRGQWFGFGIFFLVIALGAYTVHLGQPWPGTVISGLGIAGIITQYLKG